MAESKFIQITAAAAAADFAHVYALDESGQVWEYDFNHRRWHALDGGREPIIHAMTLPDGVWWRNLIT